MKRPTVHLQVTKEYPEELFCGRKGQHLVRTLEEKTVTCKRCIKIVNYALSPELQDHVEIMLVIALMTFLMKGGADILNACFLDRKENKSNQKTHSNDGARNA